MPPQPPCPQRRQIYEKPRRAALDLIHLFLDDLTRQPGAETRARVEVALNDQDVLAALDPILDRFVAAGVQRDFERLRNREQHFVTNWFPQPGEREDAATGAQAYQRYFMEFIQRGGPFRLGDQTFANGVDAFFVRNPMTQHAVTTAALNFADNLKEAATRVLADWDDIQAVFFSPERPVRRLARIQSTGSDFHKGGKQVLILTFEMTDGSSERLVYKPSSVEIDARILGDSACLALQAQGPRRFEPHATLAETINRFLPEAALHLPTYRILPRAAGAHPGAEERVTGSYGYVKFLTHEPSGSPATNDDGTHERWLAQWWREASPGERAAADYMTNDLARMDQFYYQSGQLMALATTFSLRDLHYQNVITHDLQPHLIDMEDSFNVPVPGVPETGLPLALAMSVGASPTIEIVDDRTTRLMVEDVPEMSPTPSMLWVVQEAGGNIDAFAPGGNLNGALGPRIRERMYAGFVETLIAFASDGGQRTLTEWLQNNGAALNNTVVRYVPRPTSGFLQVFNTLYGSDFAGRTPWPAAPNDLAAEPYLAFRAPARGPAQSLIVDQIRASFEQWKGNAPTAWSAMNFVLEHPLHNWRDYRNLDLPSYYRLLGEQDLRNSQGDVVNPATAWAWITGTLLPDPAATPPERRDEGLVAARESLGFGDLPGALRPSARQHYFPQTGLAVVMAQVRALANLDRGEIERQALERMPAAFRPVALAQRNPLQTPGVA